MLAVQNWLKRRIYSVLMVLLAVGFVLLLAELLLTNHTDGIQMVAVYASIIGLVLAGAALFVRGSARIVVAVLMLALSLSGIYGTWEHLEEGGGELATTELRPVATQQTIALRAQEQENEENESAEAGEAGERNEAGESSEAGEASERESGEGNPPPLAPLSLAGLSVMAAVVMVGGDKLQA